MNPISHINQITTDWLTEILQQGGYLEQGHVVSVVAQDPEINSNDGPGFIANNRIAIQYSSDATLSAPRRLYLKAQPGTLHKSAGLCEVTFYHSIASKMAFSPAPICFDSAYDTESGAYHLLLQDVSETHRAVHPEEPATQSDIKDMLNTLAKFHAHWWGHQQLGESIGTKSSPEEIRDSFAQLASVFDEYMDFLGDRLSTERRRVYELVLDRYPNILVQRMAQRHTLTLVHNDAHAGNFLLPRIPSQSTYLIDWQQWDIHTGLHDVAYLIALFWYPERRERFEQWAVRHYHEQLCESGVNGFDWQSCWNDYRLQAIENLFVPFWAWFFQKKDWGFHRWHQLEKAMLAFIDLHCDEILK